MKKIDSVMNLILDTFSVKHLIDSVQNNNSIGIDAAVVQEKLGIVRNNASTILNQLWKDTRLVKINSRPVTFIPRTVIEKLQQDYTFELKDTYTAEDLKNALKRPIQQNIADPFQHLLGSSSSLLNQIGQAKAAIIYPPKGLHTLILGEGGVGKTTFAHAMYEYGMQNRAVIASEFPFIAFNCADYFNNPQLLLSQLFGYVKGAFTGAEQEKYGLVEKANGGILFLDEVHRLPPSGQEMLFYLMDKGEYHRLGESTKRTSNVLIIAATTEEPSCALLSTFLRRIPVIITLPPFREKPISEKIEIIENFFYCEAVNLNMRIIVSPEVLKAIAISDFKSGNIGQLRSEIKLLCAKSFLQHLQNNQEILVDFKMLDKEIREGLFHYAKVDNGIQTYLNMFSENIIISPNDDKEYYPLTVNTDIYDLIIKKLDSLKMQGLSKESIDQELSVEIENYFSSIMKHFAASRLNIQHLYKLVPQEIVDVAVEFIHVAQSELLTKFNNKFVFGLAFHIQALLKRIAEGKNITNPHMGKIKREYPEEFNTAKGLVKKLGEKFGVIIPEDEKGFLALLLSNNKLETRYDDKIGIIVVCHGDSTASSITNVANTLLNTEWVKAIDMPLDATITEIYNKVRTAAMAINRGKGILLLVDMGSLLNFTGQLMNETGIKIKTIDNVSTLLVLEALRNVLYKNDDLKTLYHSLTPKKSGQIMYSPDKNTKKAILTVCVTGQGSSIMAKNILDGLLKNRYQGQVEIIVTNYLDAEKTLQQVSKTYEVIAVVGNIKPELNIPYFPINKLIDENFQKQFLKFLNTTIQNNSNTAKHSKSVYELSKEMLEQYVKYINPKLAVVNIKKFIEQINYITKDHNDILDLIVHMGCMLDRCIHKDEVKFDTIAVFIKKHRQQFYEVRAAVDNLEKEYDITINDDEVCYIIKIINR